MLAFAELLYQPFNELGPVRRTKTGHVVPAIVHGQRAVRAKGQVEESTAAALCQRADEAACIEERGRDVRRREVDGAIRSYENAGDVIGRADLPDVINGVIVKLINGLRGLANVSATRGLCADGPQRREHGGKQGWCRQRSQPLFSGLACRR